MSNTEFDQLTRELTAFESFDAMLDTPPTYRPTIYPRDQRHVALANAYDAAQIARGDPRRAYRGTRDTTPVSITLPRNEWQALALFLAQHEDEIIDGGWIEVETVRSTLDKETRQ